MKKHFNRLRTQDTLKTPTKVKTTKIKSLNTLPTPRGTQPKRRLIKKARSQRSRNYFLNFLRFLAIKKKNYLLRTSVKGVYARGPDKIKVWTAEQCTAIF
jgi:hypothetical protein